MILDNELTSLGGTAKKQDFSIDMNEHVFKMLTSNIYTDTVLAVMREWSTNAIDACIDAGLPIKYDVNMPTILQSEFSVRDYGTGLSEEDILGLFSMLGASTKRTSNKFNGTFGIGRMAGLAYSSSFNIESYLNGEKISYLISTDSGIPQTISLGKTTTDEPNGLKLTVPVQVKDQRQFESKAADLYRFFSDKPTLNKEIKYPDVKVDIEGKDWYIEDTNYYSRYSNKVLAIMGNVAYEVPTQDFRGTSIESIAESSLRLEVPLGEVSITPGRESLSMDDKTIDYLTKRMVDVSNEASEDFHNNISKLPTAWERAIKYNESYSSLPYNIRGSISHKLSSDEKEYYTIRRDRVVVGDLESPGLIFQTWSSNRVTGRTYSQYDRIRVSEKTLLMVADIRINIRDAVEKLRETTNVDTVIVIKAEKWDKDNIPAHVKLAEAFLSKMGNTTYVKASDYFTPIQKSKNGTYTRTASEFNPVVFYVVSHGLSVQRGNKLSSYKSKNYYYVETNGLTVTNMTDYVLSIHIRFARLYKEQNSKQEDFMIVGVPKTGMPNIKNDPRFIPLEGALNHLVKDVVITDTTKPGRLFGRFLTKQRVRQLLDINELPKNLTSYFKVLADFDDKYPHHTAITDISSILSIFKCKSVEPDTTYTLAEMQLDYPLLTSMTAYGHTIDNNKISRYTLLEEQNKGLTNGI